MRTEPAYAALQTRRWWRRQRICPERRSRKLYLAGDTVYCCAVEETLKNYEPDVVAVNCCEATTPHGRLIMNLSDVEAVCRQAPNALIIATHPDSVNHALPTGDDVRSFVKTHGLTQVYVPGNGEAIEA